MEYITSFEKVGIIKGRKEGRQEGIKLGERRGKLEGKLEGVTEAQTAVARKMLSKSFDLKMIAEISGLSESTIKALKTEMVTYERKEQKPLFIKDTPKRKNKLSIK